MLMLNAGDGIGFDEAQPGVLRGRLGDVVVELRCERWREALPASDVVLSVARALLDAALAAQLGTPSRKAAS